MRTKLELKDSVLPKNFLSAILNQDMKVNNPVIEDVTKWLTQAQIRGRTGTRFSRKYSQPI